MHDIQTMIVERVQNLCRGAGVEVSIDADTRLGELSLDSLKLVELIFELERDFAIQANEEQLAQLETVGDIVAMFQSVTPAAAIA